MTIKITKNEVEKAKMAREAALKKDPEFRAYITEIEKMVEKLAHEQGKKVK